MPQPAEYEIVEDPATTGEDSHGTPPVEDLNLNAPVQPTPDQIDGGSDAGDPDPIVVEFGNELDRRILKPERNNHLAQSDHRHADGEQTVIFHAQVPRQITGGNQSSRDGEGIS